MKLAQQRMNNFYSNNINNKCYSKQSNLDNQFICDVCGKNNVIKNNFPSSSNIDCYSETEGYYLDENDFNYKPCYESCKTCKINGNDVTHNCLECNEQYIYYVNLENTDYKNCFIENPSQITTLTNTYFTHLDTTIILPEINNYKSELNLISTYDTSNSNEMITNIIPTTFFKFQNQSETVLNAIEKLINDFNMIEMNNGIAIMNSFFR